jgi:hypothetical protein
LPFSIADRVRDVVPQAESSLLLLEMDLSEIAKCPVINHEFRASAVMVSFAPAETTSTICRIFSGRESDARQEIKAQHGRLSDTVAPAGPMAPGEAAPLLVVGS